MDKEDLARLTKRTAEVLASFTKNYLAAFISINIKASISGAVEKAIAELKDGSMALTGKSKDTKDEIKFPDDKGMVVTGVGGHNHQWDFDGSEFTDYDVVSAYIHAGQSRLRTSRKRYRTLLRLHEDLEKQAKDEKQEFPSDAKFPGKKFWGNMDSDFVKEREEGLRTYLQAVSASKIATTGLFLKAFDLKPDPEAERAKEAYLMAFSKTCDEFNIWFWDDPNDFEDEGAALTVLMVQIARREFYTTIEDKLYSSISISAVRWRAIVAMRNMASKAVGKSVQELWGVARVQFNTAKKIVDEKIGELKEKLDEVVSTVVSKVIGVVAAKIAEKKKESKSKEEDTKTDEKDEKKEEPGWPGAEKSVFTAKLLEAVAANAKSTDDLKKVQKTLAEEFTLKRKISRKMTSMIREIPDYYLQWTFYRFQEAIEGTIDLFHSNMNLMAEGLVTIFSARDTLEAKLVAIAESGKSAEECKAAAKTDIEAADAAIADGLKKLAVEMGRKIYHNKSQLRWQLRSLQSSASAGIFDLAVTMPEAALNLLSIFRFNFLSKIPTIFDETTKANEVGVACRKLFLSEGVPLFDWYFRNLWANLTETVSTTGKLTCVYQLKEFVWPAVQSLLESLQSLIPSAVAALGIELPSMADQVTTQLLTAVAGQLLGRAQKKIEAYVFAEEEEPSKEDQEAEKARKEKDDKEREEKKKKDDAYNSPPSS